MMRKPWGGLCAAVVFLGVVTLSAMSAPKSSTEAGPPVRLLGVAAATASGGSALEVEVSGPFTFTSYQPNARGVIVDLAGVVAERASGQSLGKVAWVAGYRFLPFRNASGRHVLRLELTLAQDCPVEVTQPQPARLRMACSAAGTPSAPKPSAPSAQPTLVPVKAPSAAPRKAETPALVSKVEVHKQAQGVTINIEASGELQYEARTYANPTRLVVDLPESILRARQRRFAVDAKEVVGVRLAQFKAQPPVTRLVVDLVALVPYEITPTADGLTLTLKSPEAASNELVPVAVPSSELARKAPAKRQPSEESPAPPLVASLAPMIPANLAPESPTASEPAEIPETQSYAGMTNPDPAEDTQAQAAMPGQQAPRRYTGEPISVNLKDVDLKDFFRLVHEISGLNIIVDPNVRGNVTMVLIDVPWDQALDIVLKNNSLGSTLEGNVLRIATLGTLKKEQEEQKDLAKARAEAVDPITVTRQLSYAKSGDLENALKRFLSSRGEIIRDDRTNTLIIRDIPSVIPDMDNLIQQLDRKSLQVEIEARVVSASRAFAREIGFQLATSFKATGGRSVFGGALGASPLTMSDPPPPLQSGSSAGTQPLFSDFRVGTATSGFLYGFRSTNFALDAILTMAESRNIAKVLSKPRLVTQNNVAARVEQGDKIPVQTVVNNTISTQFIDVVLRLVVTPQITHDGTVFLNVLIENTAINAGIDRINGIPALSTQSTTTQVLIPDGGTVVIGGVMVTNNSTNIEQVPLLGSIPILGHLFKNTRVDTTTTELLFFITPRILPG
ncbi:MAG: type IV pilus secretin PilQ [Candidatus Acidiferrales bacterium]